MPWSPAPLQQWRAFLGDLKPSCPQTSVSYSCHERGRPHFSTAPARSLDGAQQGAAVTRGTCNLWG
jgi:hypothetical protein